MAGFTLIELVLVIALLAILTGMAVPAFSSFIQKKRLETTARELQGVLQYARSEAIRRGRPVVVCASDDGETCSGNTGWESGWIVFMDTNGDNSRNGADPEERVLRLQGRIGRHILVASRNGSYLKYRPDGRIATAIFVLEVCSVVGDAVPEKITVLTGGRLAVKRDESISCNS